MKIRSFTFNCKCGRCGYEKELMFVPHTNLCELGCENMYVVQKPQACPCANKLPEFVAIQGSEVMVLPQVQELALNSFLRSYSEERRLRFNGQSITAYPTEQSIAKMQALIAEMREHLIRFSELEQQIKKLIKDFLD